MSTRLDFLEPFRTTEFGYDENSIIDIEIQPFYDGSVNIISACEDTAPRIVNSGQKFLETEVELVIRDANNLDNVYSNNSIEKTLLIPIIGDIVPSLTFNEVAKESGQLVNGGYVYYFKLKTSDGIESAVVEESRLVSVHSGTSFGKAVTHTDNTITSNSVRFTLSNLSTKVYKYVSVYYTRATGITDMTVKSIHHIDKDYEIKEISDGVWECSITHTGFETESLVDTSEITASYSPIDSAVTVTQKNSRLLLGNIKALSVTDSLLKTAALSCFVEEDLESPFYIEQPMYNGNTIIGNGYSEDTYANPYNIYNKTAYFPGETYELAINYVFTNGSISAAYPIMGFDWENHGTTTWDDTKLGEDIGWYSKEGGFSDPKVQNSYGVVRMKNIDIEDTMYESAPANRNMAKMRVYTMAINTTKMVTDNSSELYALGVRSYFISRRKRIPDLLMEGLVTLAATAPISSMHPHENSNHTFGTYLGYGLQGSLANNTVLFPVPGSAMPFSTEGVDLHAGESTYYFDGILYAPLADKADNRYFAFYSPDITSDTARAAAINTKANYSLYTSSLLSQSIGYVEQNLVTTYIGNIHKYAYSANPYRFTDSFDNPLYENAVISKFQYVDDSLRSFSSMNFTGKLDRQVSWHLYNVLKSLSEDGYQNVINDCMVFNRAAQALYGDEQLKLGNDVHYLPDGLLQDIHNCCGGVLCDPPHPYVQILMTGVNYSPFIGLQLSDAISTRITNALSLTADTGSPPIHGYFTAYDDVNHTIPADGATEMGAIARIYSSSNGSMMTATDWINKYSVTRAGSYSAISERYEITHPVDILTSPWAEAFLKGGDCYAGFYYQRVWRPGGIEGIPTANNPSLYINSGDDVSSATVETREGVNITNSGYAIGFPVRSNYNFAIRALYEADDVETKLYGKSRTYTSSLPEGEVHGNRQPETSIINYGNILHDSIMTFEQFDASIPYLKLDYNNRITTSEISVTGEFENGFRNFKGLNFKDYDEDRGSIVAMVSMGLYTYVVYKDGVSLIEISERSAITSEDTNTNVYIASADVLPPKTTPVLTNIGSQHLKSIIPTEAGVFGVDADSKKIWVVNTTEKKIISDMFIQTILNDLVTPDLDNIITSYDVTFNEVTFTFIYTNDTQKSVVYNVVNGLWYGTTDIHKLYQFNVEDRMLSIQRPEESSIYNLYFPVVSTEASSLLAEVGKTTAIDDRELLTKDVYNSYIEFVIKSEQLIKFDLSNLIINGTGIPSSIDIIAESLEEYTVDTADSSISSLTQHTLPIHTNIYMQDADAGNLEYIDSYRFKRFRNSSFKTLAEGDRITLDLDGMLQQLRIANITYNSGDSSDTIVLSNPMVDSTMTRLYFGWKVPLRLSLGENMGGKVKLTIPTKKHANLLKGVTETDQNYHVNYSNAKPYGRWVKLRLNFEGVDQIYIESVMSEITLRYS